MAKSKQDKITAIKKRSAKAEKRRKLAIERQAEKKAQELRKFHKAGVEANEVVGDTYGHKVNEHIAKIYGRSAESIYQARSFAKMVDETDALPPVK